ncbi:Hemolymph proteinase 9, partial [Operophtera brumata]
MKHRSKSGPHFAIGGRNTEPGEFPHMAAVGTWVFKCGSSLISSRFVLTAAHCTSVSSRDTTITDPFSNGFTPTDAMIAKIIVHPKYTSPKKYFDIALMELDRVVDFSRYIQPACLWGQFDTGNLGKKATVTGWGVIDSVDIILNKECDSLLRPSCSRHWCGIQKTQMCAGKLAGGVDACQGDSGGPLQVKIPLPITTQGSMHYVIGVTSFGIECALPNLPGVYTRVSSFIDCIENNVWR